MMRKQKTQRGGSLPIAPISEVLGAPFVIVPIVNADNNQHAPNENIRMREFRRGERRLNRFPGLRIGA